MAPYDRNQPHNSLPPLPPPEDLFYKTAVLLKLASARGALGQLDGILKTLPYPEILLNSISLREAKASTEIENIYTSTDDLYQALTLESREPSGAVKEVFKYREAVRAGLAGMAGGKISEETVINVYRAVKGSSGGIRPPHVPITIKKAGSTLTSGDVVYTPPRGRGVLEQMLADCVNFINDDAKYPYDPLLKLGMAHYQFEAIHPFSDGNGRTGRILNLLMLVAKGLLSSPILYLSRHIVHNKEEYYYRLGAVTERRDWANWLLFMLETVESTARHTISIIESINGLLDSTQKYVQEELPGFNPEILRMAFKQPYIRARKLAENPASGAKSWKTADKRLTDLCALGILEKKEFGKETVYINTALMDILREA